MAITASSTTYVPGAYAKPREPASRMADRLIGEWDRRRLAPAMEEKPRELPPTICFSRKIGVGALEIADLVGERIGYRVVDRAILEHICREADLSRKTVAIFDERYPGKLNELLAMAFGEKSFIKSDYARHLFSAVFAIANLEPTIFVGRGTHLLLPRDRVLAVRCICSRENRVKRVAGIMHAAEAEAGATLDRMDREQKEFFKAVYGKKEASPHEFDLVINTDHIREPAWAAGIVREAFGQKFGGLEACTPTAP